jgi:tetratricopeptide (TPR) repeat protein
VAVLQPLARHERAAAPLAAAGARLRAGSFFFAAFAALALAGCVSLPQSEALREAPPAGLPPRAELKAVPFHVQDDFLCGPAALAMAFGAAGVRADVETLTPQVYLPGRQGSLQAEMLGATRRNGLVAYRIPPRLDALLGEIAAGTPVVVLLNLGLRLFPVWHYAVAVGYDLEQGEVILRTGRRERAAYSLGFLEFLWQDAGHWGMVALAPGRVAASAAEPEFAAAVAALEQAGRRAEAREAYRALLERWPASHIGLIGLGNTEYALGDLAAAARAFRRAADAHPESAPAHNNLAHALAALGRIEEAEAAARRAVAIGGPHAAEAKKTLDAILARRAARQ